MSDAARGAPSSSTAPSTMTGLRLQRLLEEVESPDRLEWLSVVRGDQFKRWQRGDRVPVETYLQQVPQLAADPEALLDLIFSEVLLREELGEPPDVEEYVRRFPRQEASLRLQFDVCKAFRPEAVAAQP